MARNTYIINKNFINNNGSAGGGGLNIVGVGDTASMNGYVGMVLGDIWANSETNSLWVYDGSAWVDMGGLGVDLTDYQTPKLTKDDGTALQHVADESTLVTLNVGEYSVSRAFTQLITGNDQVSALNVIAGAGLFKVAILHDYIAGEMWMSFYSINATTPPLTWTKIGGSTVDLTNYQTPALTGSAGQALDPFNIIDSDSTLIATIEKTGMHSKLPDYPAGSPGNGTIFIMPMGGSSNVKEVIAFSKTTIHTALVRDTDTVVEWTQIGGGEKIPTLQEIYDNAPLSVNAASGAIEVVPALYISSEGYSTPTHPNAIEKYDENILNITSDKIYLGVSGTEYDVAADVVLFKLTELIIDDDMAELKRSRDSAPLADRTATELINKGEVEELLPYEFVKKDGNNLAEITSDSDLFASTVGFYDKGSYSIGGSTSSGMIQVFEYGNTSGYKKANAYFNNEIWTATFKGTGFSGSGWEKIAEKVHPYFENITVTSPITLTSTPQTITTIDNTVVIKARAYLTALISRTGGTSAVGVVTVTLSDGTNTFTADYDIGRDLTTTVHLNTAKRLNFPAGTVTLSASYNGTGTVTVNNISASLE